MAAWRIGGIRR